MALPVTLPCVLLFQITSSVRHGCGRPTAAPGVGWWLDNLVTGMGWNWQNMWLAPILWTRDWPFPAHDQNLKHQKHDLKGKKGHETEPSIPLITTSYVEASIWRASVCLPVKTVSITKPEKHFSAHTGAKPALMWTIKFSVPENVAVCYILQCNFPLIQVNGSALSCFSDLRRQMFRPGLISNVIWNVISNCLSQSGLELNLSF